MSLSLTIALHPPPEPEQLDTGLRYTDILFGFVIRELFVRLQNWLQLDGAVRLHLIVGTILVLGSWIGYRGSLYRTTYKLKFFNLPLFRFIVDQLMLIFYFRIAVLTEIGKPPPPAGDLARQTTKLVMLVFFLYVVWDCLGIWIAKAKRSSNGNKEPLYPKLNGIEMTNAEQPANLPGVFISLFVLVLFFLLWMLTDCLGPSLVLLVTAALLVVYRLAKEIRTSCQLRQQA